MTERSGPAAAPDLEFVYVGDPMCSWCWGFVPALEAIDEAFTIPIRTVAGGLRPGPDSGVVDDRMRAYLRHHWEEVEKASGQPFDHRGLERESWTYDTLVPCVAVVQMRSLRPHETLRFFARLQQAFYAGAVDITDPAVYPDLLAGFDVDEAGFVDGLSSDDWIARTWKDFEEARRYGADGFPTLLLRDGTQLALVTRGWTPTDPLIDALEKWIVQRHGDAADGLVCRLGEPC